MSGDETPIQDHLADSLSARGFDVDAFDIDVAGLTHDPWFSAEVERVTAKGVVATLGDTTGPGPHLLFNGHVDVVPAGDEALWSAPPFAGVVRDGRIVGRGACDMKGGLAAAMHAADAVRRAGITLAGSVTIAPVVGEEDGGTGTLALLRRGINADACVIPEPSNLHVVPAVAGALSWRIRVPGKAAHGCLREEGVSALENLWPIQQAIAQFEHDRNATADDGLFSWLQRPFAICGGRIRGGDWPSSEMDWLEWEGRFGIRPGEDIAAARQAFEQTVTDACAHRPWLADHPAKVAWWGGQFYPGATALDAPIVEAVQSAAATVTNPVQTRGMPYGCDLGLMTNVGGIDTVVWGPGDIRDAHSADESVAIDELVAATRGYVQLIVDMCGAANAADAPQRA